jgi:hypothetical protein
MPEAEIEEKLDIPSLGPIKENILVAFEGGSYDDSGPNPASFNAQMSSARLEVIGFAHALRQECKQKNGLSYVGLLMEKRSSFVREDHIVCAIAAIINDVFYQDFEDPKFGSSTRTAPGLTYFQAWITKKDTSLCLALELEQEDQVSDGVKIRSLNSLEDSKAKFYEAAQHIWILHGLAHCLNPVPTLVKFERGTSFDPATMQAYHSLVEESSIDRLIEFTVHPGFKMKTKILAANVYLSDART